MDHQGFSISCSRFRHHRIELSVYLHLHQTEAGLGFKVDSCIRSILHPLAPGSQEALSASELSRYLIGQLRRLLKIGRQGYIFSNVIHSICIPLRQRLCYPIDADGGETVAWFGSQYKDRIPQEGHLGLLNFHSASYPPMYYSPGRIGRSLRLKLRTQCYIAGRHRKGKPASFTRVHIDSNGTSALLLCADDSSLQLIAPVREHCHFYGISFLRCHHRSRQASS